MSTPPSSGPAHPAAKPPPGGQRNLAAILAVIGILAAILGLLYLFAASSLPSALEGSSHTGHHVYRAVAAFVVAAACLVGAWLASRRRQSAGGG